MDFRTRYTVPAVLFVFLSGCLHKTPTDSAWVTGWDSGYMETKGGDGDNKKLGMQVKYQYQRKSDGTYIWEVNYHLISQDNKVLGWSKSGYLYSFWYSFSFHDYYGTHLETDTLSLIGQSEVNAGLFTGHSPTAAGLPVFTAKQTMGQRSGGSSGISITW